MKWKRNDCKALDSLRVKPCPGGASVFHDGYLYIHNGFPHKHSTLSNLSQDIYRVDVKTFEWSLFLRKAYFFEPHRHIRELPSSNTDKPYLTVLRLVVYKYLVINCNRLVGGGLGALNEDNQKHAQLTPCLN